MNTYSGFKESLKKLSYIYFGALIGATITLIFVPSLGVKILIMMLLLPTIHLTYQGMVTKITLDKDALKIHRLMDVTTIPIKDVAFCAVHGIDDGRFLVYCFMRKGRPGKDGVKGIRGRYSFNDVVRILAEDDGTGQTSLDINFTMAKKVPASFVDNSEDLKNRLLLMVDESHLHLLK